MDDDTTNQFVSILASSIQDFCHGRLKFSSTVEVVGHIHLNIDRNIKLDYVLSEEVNKITNGSSFLSHSYLSKPPDSVSEASGLIVPSDSDNQQDDTNNTHVESSTVNTNNINSLAVVASPQAALSNEGTTSTIHSTESALMSQPLNISVSLGCSALPIVKQENDKLPEVHTSETDWSENCRPVSIRETDSHQSSSLSRDSGQAVSAYMHENIQVPYEINIQPAVLERSAQEHSQSVVTSQLIQQSTETQNQISETPQPSVIGHNLQNSQSAESGLSVQRTYHINVQSESSPSVNTIERQPSVNYSQTNCQSAVGQSVQGVSGNTCHEDASSSDSHHTQVAANFSQMNFGDLAQLGVIQVKQECIDEPSDVTYPFSSSREIEMEIPEYGNVVIESLGQQMDGTQLVVMRESIQDSQQPFPFPVMLHSHSAMSAHVGASSGTPVSMMPMTSSAVSLPGPGAGLQTNPSSNTDVSSKEAKGKRSNNCRTRKKAEKAKKSLQTMHTFQSGSAVKKTKAEDRKTCPGAVKSRTAPSPAAAAAAKMDRRRKPSSQQLGTVKNISSTNKSQKTKRQKNTQSVNRNNKSQSQTKNSKHSKETKRRKSSEGSKSKTSRRSGPVHMLTRIPWNGQTQQPRKRCHVCRKKGLVAFSSYACYICPNQSGYCRIRSCFSSYHSKMGVKYSE